MEPWLVLLLLGTVCLAIGLFSFKKPRPCHPPIDGEPAGHVNNERVAPDVSSVAETPGTVLAECRPPRTPDMFDESRVHRDLYTLANKSGSWSQRIAVRGTARYREKEIALINQWTNFYNAGAEMIKSKTALLRTRNEYLGLQREDEERNAQKAASVAKHQADAEEDRARAAKARAELRRYDSPDAPAADEDPLLAQYKSELMADAKKEVFDKFALPTLTKIQATKLRDDLRAKIDRDLNLPDQEKDSIKGWLDDLYNREAQKKKLSIYED